MCDHVWRVFCVCSYFCVCSLLTPVDIAGLHKKRIFEFEFIIRPQPVCDYAGCSN